MTLLVALPIVLPMIAGAFSLLFWWSRRAQRILAVAGTAMLLTSALLLLREVISGGTLVLEAGNWPAPFGIVLVADLLSAIFAVMTGVVGLAVAVCSLCTVGQRFEQSGYYGLMHLLLAGVAGAFLTGDIFNLYVWFEVLLLASFALLAMGGERPQMAGAIKYVVLNLISSALFLTAVGLLYGLTGTLNMADLSVKLALLSEPERVTAIATLFMVAFGIKAAAFPLFFWLPASYHTAPVAVAALFAGLLTKVGVYALYRTFTLLFVHEPGFTLPLLQGVAAATMLVGALGAVAQTELRRTLAFAHIAQVGYLLMAVGLQTPLALAGGAFYVVHHILVVSNLFLVAGVVYLLQGSYRLERLGGLWKERPWLGVVFLASALSLAGIPPLSGFWAKFLVIRAAIEADAAWLAAIALATGLLTLYAVLRIWNAVFWKDRPEAPEAPEAPADPARVPAPVAVVVGLLAAATLALGIVAEPLWQLAEAASAQLLDTAGYAAAVLGEAP